MELVRAGDKLDFETGLFQRIKSVLLALLPGPPFVRLCALFYDGGDFDPEFLPDAIRLDPGIFYDIMENTRRNNLLGAPCFGEEHAYSEGMEDICLCCPFPFLLFVRFYSDFNGPINQVHSCAFVNSFP